jgi:hypothetical protein
MTGLHPGVTGQKNAGELEPLAVSPRQACSLLNIGNTRLYQLLGARELDSYNEGRTRKITMASIKARVVRLAATDSVGEAPTADVIPTIGEHLTHGV